MKKLDFEAALNGDSKAFSEICNSVESTFYMLVEKNYTAFKLPYEKDDYKNSFETEVWTYLSEFDPNRGCSFNTYFYNRVQWRLSNFKTQLKRGRFEMPFSGLKLSEDEDSVDRFTQGISNSTEYEYGSYADALTILERAEKFPEKERFFVESVLGGSKIIEAIQDVSDRFGCSRQGAYNIKNSAISKLKRYAKAK